MSRSNLERVWKAGLGALLLSLAPHATAGGPPQIPNSIRYRGADQALPATGRSGSATLQARALLGMDGTTTLDLSTADLDAPAAAPGNIRQVQVKGFDTSGATRFTRTYQNLSLGGALSLPRTDLLRNQPIQIQASIENLDGQRMDVVTVQTRVARRPDLKVENLSAPATALAGTQVILTAGIREMNADLGARTSVVLYVDGLAADRADDVWVDADGSVSVAFSHRFETAGQKQVVIKVEGTLPADDDPSNNLVAGVVEVTLTPPSPVVGLTYSVSVLEDYSHRTITQRSSYVDNSSTSGHDSSYDYDREYWEHFTNFNFSTSTRVAFPVATFTVDESTGGVPISSLRFENIAADWDTGWSDGAGYHRTQGFQQYDPATRLYVWVISTSISSPTTGEPLSAYSVGYFQRFGTLVVYYSANYSHDWYGTSGNFYSWTESSESHVGTPVPLGSTYSIRLAFKDARGTVFQALPTMPIQMTHTSSVEPYTCTLVHASDGTYQICSGSTSTSWVAQATASGSGTP